MAKNSRTLTYNKIVVTTAEHIQKKVEDAIFAATPTLDRFKKMGKDYTGGEKIRVPLMYAKNPNVGSYSGYDQLAHDPSDPLTAGYCSVAQYSAAASMSGLETEIENRGPEKLIDLAETLITNAVDSLAEQIAIDMWDISLTSATTGNSGKNIQSIPQFIQMLDSAPGGTKDIDILGIDQSTETWWKNQCKTSSNSGTTTFAYLTSDIRETHQDTMRGGAGWADLAVCDPNTWLGYMNALDNRVQYTQTDKADIGFRGVMCDGAELIWDRFVPDAESGYNYGSLADGTLYWIRTKDWDFYQVPDRKFKIYPPVDMLPRQDAKTVPILWAGQLVCRNRRNQGVLYDILTAINA